VRILVDQSGYDLLNLGDVAMLQGCAARLYQQWPGAEIRVIAHVPERLQQYCPGAMAVERTFADLQFAQIFPRKARLASEQFWKMTGPHLSERMARQGHREDENQLVPKTAIQAVRWADVVVASGGGYITDTWWWHAAGVLSLIDLAQRLGKPTAMFGQGIGPLQGRMLRALTRKVLPQLTVLGIREELTSLDLALSLGAPREIIRITGDDALEVIADAAPAPADALGVNIRAARYTGIGPDVAAMIGEVVVQVASDLCAAIVALPVCRYPAAADLATTRASLSPAAPGTAVTMSDLASPGELSAATAGCRVVVAVSYHAAVFALAQGVPAVCLSKSSYYDAKFAGLNEMFPEACQVISLTGPDPASQLRRAIQQAWDLPSQVRSGAREVANRQRNSGSSAYADFRMSVERLDKTVVLKG
jgi:polysaccharide pyruvyl transferase WcaK-like protein